MIIYKLMYDYKGTQYTSSRWTRNYWKASKKAMNNANAGTTCTLLVLKRENKSEILIDTVTFEGIKQ